MLSRRLEVERSTAGREPGLYFDFVVDWCGWETSEHWLYLGLVAKMINHTGIWCRKAAITSLLHQYKED